MLSSSRIHTSATAGSYGRCKINLVGYAQTVFQGGDTIFITTTQFVCEINEGEAREEI